MIYGTNILLGCSCIILSVEGVRLPLCAPLDNHLLGATTLLLCVVGNAPIGARLNLGEAELVCKLTSQYMSLILDAIVIHSHTTPAEMSEVSVNDQHAGAAGRQASWNALLPLSASRRFLLYAGSPPCHSP
jgi:hypothetical protein